MLTLEELEVDEFDGADELLSEFLRGLRPVTDLSVSQWADQSRVLDKPFTKNRMRWRTDYVPYTREIMDCLSANSPVKKVAWMKSAQVAGSETGNNWLGYTIEHNPGALMLVNPTKGMVKRMSARVQALIDSSDGLNELVLPARMRDSGNTQFMKKFPGGFVLMVGAQSAPDLRSYAWALPTPQPSSSTMCRNAISIHRPAGPIRKPMTLSNCSKTSRRHCFYL